MVSTSASAARRRSRPRLSLRRPQIKSVVKFNVLVIGLIVFSLSIFGLWVCIMFISPGIAIRSYAPVDVPPMQPLFQRGENIRGGGDGRVRSLRNENRRKGRSGSTISLLSRKPRVVGMYAYQLNGTIDDGMIRKGGRNYLPPYMYLTERIDKNLLSHSPIQTLRRIRRHDRHSSKTALSDLVLNYKLAISGSNSYIISEDPLSHLMLSSKSRDSLREIAEDSDDYESYMADPLNNEECEATPQNEKWMSHSFPTCNFMHENDMQNSLQNSKTRLLGNGYWRDVWPVLDAEPLLSRSHQPKKVALKTMRYEHDYTERNYDRHVRDAIVSERLTSSPRVTAIYSFCGNSGYYEFGSNGSLTDRLEQHDAALTDSESKKQMGRGHDAKSNDERLLGQYEKLSLAYQAAAGLADLHDTDAMRDANGEIISAAMVHADIKSDQFINIGGVYKLNDFNRCRFMRRYRNSAKSGGGDGKPCGFTVGNNSGKGRSPEEYAYAVETEKIDIYSLGNIFYTILTNLDPFDDYDGKEAIKAIMKGKRPEVPAPQLKSNDPVDVALRKVMYQCWKHKPKDRPRARALADILSKELSLLNHRQEDGLATT